MKNRLGKWLFFAGFLALWSAAAATVSLADTKQANYQVFVVNSAGTPVNAPVAVTVSFYDAAVAGTPYWSETQTVTPDSGLFIVNLGKTNPFNLSFDRPYFVGVSLGAEPESASRMAVNGPGSYSQAGAKSDTQALNVKYQWLNIDVR